ncbi:copia protein, partial [Tanacetum coccineum]
LSDDDSDDSDGDTNPLYWHAFAKWEIVPTGLGDVNALYFTDKSSKYFTHLREILHLLDRQDLSKLYGMVVKHYEANPIAGAGMMLWGDLHVLFKSVEGGSSVEVWADQKDWVVHTPYPLSASTMKKMLKHKLEVEINGIGNDMTHAEQLIAFIKNRLAALASPEQTATGKDTSNPFMAVMTCQKSYSSSTYYDSCSESGKWFQSSMDLTLSGCGVPVAVHVFWRRFQDVAAQSSGTRYEVAERQYESVDTCTEACVIREHKNVTEALKDESWIIAMQEELNQFIANDVWELVPQPKFMKIIGAKWVFRNKLDENGIVSRHKARLVEQGYNQQEGIDYDKTYTPETDIETVVADSDHTGDYVDRKSNSGIRMLVGCCLTSWFSKKKTALAISTTKAEYVSAKKACQQAVWMKRALYDYGNPTDDVQFIYDNKGAIDLSKNPMQHSQTKHVEIRHRFLRDNVQKGSISIEKVPSKDNIANILTKPLKLESFNYLRLDAYTPYSDPRGFIYENKDKKNRLMRIDELHKFSDGTLDDVRTTLNDCLKGIRMEYLPQTFWSQHDKANARAMIQAIDKRLKTRRIMRSLERFVGGRPYGGDLRLLQRTI